MWPVEPPESPYVFDLEGAEPDEDLVGLGGGLDPGTLLQAYRQGFFPMGVGEFGGKPLGWWSPNPRGVLLPGALRVTKSLKKSMRHFEIRIDTAFDDVVAACADPKRHGAWITDEIAAAYGRLHQLGWAHSVEAWQGERLVGGLYGVGVGGLFAGESMFHHVTDASKAALAGLVAVMETPAASGWLIDVQWQTPHLESLGVIEVSRQDYLQLLPTVRTGQHRWVSTRTRHGYPDHS
ncbi:leucyl/phenylalanyl-tRNA--protein transferase [Ornithinimicrobium sp. INDO-MA30-4]|uniref:leucyl/phenylalanyl-tRNA--protein transferase n=1 Tax=Ornithinimicrobium sp. INDO-MA30-4 TaxID=2908651 RepID=UPI001F317BC8|nr:leucyl/phenylalanyl-tRNA--protein transferase [Ornithinimicrobium sp. INDO-MA30-4]UJH71316.1 leucyl/phenylalanyl-tRNA--protein transferase [Ornithinimicrobium sp. INDO-MA30-4]